MPSRGCPTCNEVPRDVVPQGYNWEPWSRTLLDGWMNRYGKCHQLLGMHSEVFSLDSDAERPMPRPPEVQLEKPYLSIRADGKCLQSQYDMGDCRWHPTEINTSLFFFGHGLGVPTLVNLLSQYQTSSRNPMSSTILDQYVTAVGGRSR